MKDKRKLCSVVLFIVFFVQLLALNSVSRLYVKFEYNHEQLRRSYTELSSTVINKTIREHQRSNLDTIKQSWKSYLNDDKDLINRDGDSNPIYENENGSVSYDNKTMYKTQRALNMFDIYDIATGTLILESATPKWDNLELESILNTLIKPMKNFGNKGGFIVFDSYSGEIFLDTTSTKRLAGGQETYLADDLTSDINKNTQQTAQVIDNIFMARKDSTSLSNIIYNINENTNMGKNENNFDMFPLGEYNRQFIEMSVMPYETIGFDGQLMQLTILSVVDESDVFTTYNSIFKDVEQGMLNNKQLYGQVSALLIFSLAISMGISLGLLYYFKSKNNINE